ncbi:bifunctional prephenate dehydrogenase/3-phosphoshikimate 1-carboxyvinyltransferase [Porticoccaceae bacterium LTM1]|nr:bifunctional prephenate dehydrogenase/3-phosphoshikimate 1-carboxyvinyltransferase [Porticoccaceae bacterium LTM1]
MAKICNKLVVIGLGLIGGSLAKAARVRGLCQEVIGVARDDSTCQAAVDLGVVDRAFVSIKTIADELNENDIVVIAVPTLAVAKVFQELNECLSPTVTVTDVASVKGSVVEDARRIYGKLPIQFVPGHPIAGAEKSGITAADESLYEGYKVILTPLPETSTEHLRKIDRLWSAVGAEPHQMSVEEHDEVLAATSHLPHMLAFSLVDTLAGMRENREIFRYAAGGFRDFTRIAGSDPVMWHDIALANDKAVVSVLDQLTDHLSSLRQAIIDRDSDHLLGVFIRAKEARNHFTKMLEEKPYMEPENVSDIDHSVEYIVQPGGVVHGEIRVPGDKSISHRSIMLGSLAEGITEVTGFLEGEDSLATLQAFRDMGVVIEGPITDEKGQRRVTIHGVGLHGLKAPAGPLYLGNSGTSMRLLAGLLAGQAFDTELTGDHSLSGRPMNRVAVPLREMGAEIETAEGGRPPLKIKGGSKLKGIDYKLPMASAQVKSCVLLAGLYAEGKTKTTEPAPTRDHTERMLEGFGYEVERDGAVATVESGGTLKATSIDVPADISSATFFMVAAAISPGSDITLTHVGINPTRVGVINILRLMGSDIELLNEREVGGEPVADIRVRYAPLKGIKIPEDQVPLAIDEFPALFVAAACAEGQTVLTGAEELRVKESDRIQAMADGLVVLGIDAQATEDGIVINGGQISSGEVESHDDHRIAMSFTIAGLRASGPIRIKNCNNVATSFPGFVDLAQKVGIKVEDH